MRHFFTRAISWIRKSCFVVAVIGLLQIFGAHRASADTLKTFTVATSGWAQLFQMCSPCLADPFPIDATSTITIDTSTGKLVASHITASGTSFGSTSPTLSLSAVGQFSGRALPGTATFNPAAIHGGSGSSTLTITTTNPAPVIDDYILTVSGSSGPLTRSGNVFLGIRNDGFDFTGSITPSLQNVSVGQSATFTANITYLGGFSPTPGPCLTVSVIGLPPGVQFSASCVPGGAGERDVITIPAPPGTPTGTYNLLLVGAGGGRIRRGAVTLTINP